MTGSPVRDPRLATDGAQRWPGRVTAWLPAIESALAEVPAGKAGVRLGGVEALAPLLAVDGAIGSVAAGAIGPGARPVRAILFDKGTGNNWALGWHQDRTISVRERRNVPGFGPWTTKGGSLHVAPPFAILAAMVTVRVHLDRVGRGNAPLLIAPGSHRLGRIAAIDVKAAVERCGTYACLAEPGDVWVTSTPILHASDRARWPSRRRVLQLDYASGDLPGGLEWQEVTGGRSPPDVISSCTGENSHCRGIANTA